MYKIESNGLITGPRKGQCAGYIFQFNGHGAYDPGGKIKVGNLDLTKEQVDAHNAILGNAEVENMVKVGKGIFYLTTKGQDLCYGKAVYHADVSTWAGTFKAPWVYARRWSASAWYGPIDAFSVWFTGPDGKKWYGVNKGNNQIVRARRLKHQD